MILSGNAIFKDSSINFTNQIIGSGIFYDYSVNSGNLNNACFNNYSKNFGEIYCGIFRDFSINCSNLSGGNFILADSSKNCGSISGNIKYSPTSITGILRGNISTYNQGHYSSGYFVDDQINLNYNTTFPQYTLDCALYYTFHQTQICKATGGFSDYWYCSGIRQYTQNCLAIQAQDNSKWYNYNVSGSGYYAGLNSPAYYTYGIFSCGQKITPIVEYYRCPYDDSSKLYIYCTDSVIQKFNGYYSYHYYISGNLTTLDCYGDGFSDPNWYFGGSILNQINSNESYNTYFNTQADSWGLTNNGQYKSSDRWYLNTNYYDSELLYLQALASDQSAYGNLQYYGINYWYVAGTFQGEDYDGETAFNSQADDFGTNGSYEGVFGGSVNEFGYLDLTSSIYTQRWYFIHNYYPNKTEFNNARADYWGLTNDSEYQLDGQPSNRWYYLGSYVGSTELSYNIAQADYWGQSHDGVYEFTLNGQIYKRWYYQQIYTGDNLNSYIIAIANVWGGTNDGEYVYDPEGEAIHSGRWYYQGSYLPTVHSLEEYDYYIGNNSFQIAADSWGQTNNGRYTGENYQFYTARWYWLGSYVGSAQSQYNTASTGVFFIDSLARNYVNGSESSLFTGIKVGLQYGGVARRYQDGVDSEGWNGLSKNLTNDNKYHLFTNSDNGNYIGDGVDVGLFTGLYFNADLDNKAYNYSNGIRGSVFTGYSSTLQNDNLWHRYLNGIDQGTVTGWYNFGNGNYYFINGEQTSLDQNGTGFWNSFYYSSASLASGWFNLGYGDHYYLAGSETLLNQSGDGFWNNQYYSSGSLANGYFYNLTIDPHYFINGEQTTLDENGSGYWTDHAYYINAIQTSLSANGTGWWSNAYYIQGALTTLPQSGTGWWSNTYYISGESTTLDQDGDGFWNGKAYAGGILINGWDNVGNGEHYYINGDETTLDQDGDGFWNGKAYANGILIINAWENVGNGDHYYIDGDETTLPESGTGFWNGHYYIGGMETTLNQDGNGYMIVDVGYGQQWYEYSGGVAVGPLNGDYDVDGNGTRTYIDGFAQ